MKKLKEVVEGDFRYPEIEHDAQVWLKRIPILNKVTPEGEKVSIDALDKLLVNIIAKHPYIHFQWLNLTIIKTNMPYYSMSFRNNDDYSWLVSIYGMTIYEVYAKAVLFLFAHVKKHDGGGTP